MDKYKNLNKKDLIQIIEQQTEELKNKRYGLIWDTEREPEKVVLDCENNLPVLKTIEKNKIRRTENEDNILIEGDNYHALTVLNYTHKEAIDIIYIDPPYNTGKKDEWKYNDRYVDKNDAYKHSKWLNFMEKRLNLAKNLLKKENSVIFISIDDNEVAQLKLLCDKIFGENNFVGQWSWFKSATPPNLSHKIKKNIEYILAYEKNKNSQKYTGTQKISKSDDPLINQTNSIKTLTFPPNTINFKGKDKIYEKGVYGTKKYPNKLFEELIIKNRKNKNTVSFENKFRWTQDKLDYEISKDTIINASNSLVLGFKKQNYAPEVPPSLIDDTVGVKTTEQAGKELIAMFGEKVFDFPKPVELIKYLISFLKDKKDATILDFFAGSGTTGQAVLELNKQDKGKRKFILCTNNEGNIAQEVCYPRISKVINGYTNTKKEKITGINANLQYFKTDFVKKTHSRDQLITDITKECTEMLCVKENILNLQKAENDFKIFTSNNNKKYLCIYYDIVDESFPHFYDAIKELSGRKIIYIFSETNEVNKYLFKGIKNTQIEPIPKPILDIYKELLKLNIRGKTETIILELQNANAKLFKEKNKDESARILRIVLEKIIKKISYQNGIKIIDDKGRELKSAVVNDNLMKADFFNKITWNTNKIYFNLGDYAAHGDYLEYDIKQVKEFYKHVQSLIENFNI